MAAHTAQANSISLNGGTLTYTVQKSGPQQCGAGGQQLTVYAYTVDSYTDANNNTTNWDSSGGAYFLITGGGNCPGFTQGPNPASTKFNGSSFYMGIMSLTPFY